MDDELPFLLLIAHETRTANIALLLQLLSPNSTAETHLLFILSHWALI